MPSLEQRYVDIIEAAKKLGHDPDVDLLRDLRGELARLDYEVRTTVPAGRRRELLDRASGGAQTLLAHAANRAKIARDVADAEHARELHDAQHPTVLSPRSALADYTPDTLDRAVRNYKDHGRSR
ncbi:MULTISPECIES: hypothetical protein [Nocardia]|uniref:hypothetical protein n=1 Tax=Nocardia TaxID=1817 RepID=UPI000D689B9A|nr:MULTISPECIES: hypothetical protein [Nocardia]